MCCSAASCTDPPACRGSSRLNERVALWCLLIPFALLPGAAGAAEGAAPANVLLYVVDTLRADATGAYGNREIDTPHLDRFAGEGTLFENARANSSWTRPSMASLLTGLLPVRHGTQGRLDVLPGSLDLLSTVLKPHGYHAAFVTANPNVSSVFGFERGFDETVELYSRRAPGRVAAKELVTPSDRVTEAAIDWLKRARRPFLLVVHTIDPHAPYAPPARFDRYGGSYRGPVTADPQWLHRKDLGAGDRARIRSLYEGEISFNDESLGALLGWLRAAGELDRTLAVLTSDHGEEFYEFGRRGHGESLAEAVLRIPLIVRFPASPRVGRGVRVTGTAQLIDVLPTVLDLLGLEVPAGLDGRSLFGAAQASRPAFASLVLDGASLHAVWGFPWKLVRDLRTGESSLYRVDGASEVAAPRDPEASGLREALGGELDAYLARSGGPSRQAAPGLPEDVKDALRALGYLDQP